MFAYIYGKVDSVGVDRVIIEAGGIGYELLCSENTLKRIKLGDSVKLYTHFQLSQDIITLYGFHNDEERAMFRRLIAVSKVGPKTALCALSELTPQDIALAVLMDTPSVFDKIQGVGKKTAARLILELRGTISKDALDGGSQIAMKEISAESGALRSEAVAALIALGYDGVSAGRAVAAIGEYESVEELIMLALKSMPTRDR